MTTRACLYARTSSTDKRHRAVSLDHQVEETRALAHKHGLTVAYEHVFTDIDYEGHLPPTCWAPDGAAGRPALAALITAVENGQVGRVIVHSIDRLGTDYQTLQALLELFQARGIRIILEPDRAMVDNPAETFATQVLRQVIRVDTEAEQVHKAKLRARKLEELERLRQKIARLEAEVAELNPEGA